MADLLDICKLASKLQNNLALTGHDRDCDRSQREKSKAGEVISSVGIVITHRHRKHEFTATDWQMNLICDNVTGAAKARARDTFI